jgi:low temperature requirement protein LtrA
VSDQREPAGLVPAGPGAKVTRLELFYDLVFVYAFLNVTTVTSRSLTGTALAKSLLVLALLWFAWTSFAALGNVVRTDQGVMPLLGFATMAAVFALAVTVPKAFHDEPGGLPGDLVFAASYGLVRGLQVLAFVLAARATQRPRRLPLRLGRPVLVSTALLFVAAIVPERLVASDYEFGARAGLWVLAIAVEYSIGALVPVEEALIVSVEHLAERYAQIILIAFGESIISLGTGPNLIAGLPLTWAILLAIGLGIALIAALWWVYSDTLAIAAEMALRRLPGPARATRARDGYTYLHLPMIMGIILLSLGLKSVLADIANPATPSLADTLDGIEPWVLYGGIALYLLALAAFGWRIMSHVSRVALITIAVVAVQIPIGHRIPELLALVLLVLTVIAQVVIGTVRGRRPRYEVRRHKLEEQRALEARETEWRRRHADTGSGPAEEQH